MYNFCASDVVDTSDINQSTNPLIQNPLTGLSLNSLYAHKVHHMHLFLVNCHCQKYIHYILKSIFHHNFNLFRIGLEMKHNKIERHTSNDSHGERYVKEYSKSIF